jgi:hypothetical protein
MSPRSFKKSLASIYAEGVHMKILILEDSEHNLVSAREFAEKVKGEHEVVIVDKRPVGMIWRLGESKYDVVLTDLFMESLPGKGLEPIGLFAAMKALQHNVPVAIITDGETHGDNRILNLLDGLFLEGGSEKIRVYFVNTTSDSEPTSAYYSPTKGVTPDGKAIKDWEFCFRKLTQQNASA